MDEQFTAQHGGGNLYSRTSVSLDLSGVTPLLARLGEWEPKIARKFFVRALRAGGRVIQSAARSMVPIGEFRRERVTPYSQTRYPYAPPGNLKAAIKVTQGISKKSGLPFVEIGPAYKVSAGVEVRPAYAHLVEYGTKPHSLQPKRTRKKRTWFRRNLHGFKLHPGAKPKPYLRPALDQQQQTAVNAIARNLGASLASGLRGRT